MRQLREYLTRPIGPEGARLAENLPTSVEVTKVDAAFNQTLAAVEMMLRGRYECAVTLAGAAEGMLPKTPHSAYDKALKLPVPDELQGNPYADFTEKERVAFWNEQRDWLKHRTSDKPETMRIRRLEAGAMIYRALTHLPDMALAPEQDRMITTFFSLWLHDTEWKPPVDDGLGG